ncbi:MAG: GNAT family N-acetyltransferase [Acidobacteria bacterium]|nr:GNAT family N-acetyltransferase [Acidobacteriota bacterium]
MTVTLTAPACQSSLDSYPWRSGLPVLIGSGFVLREVGPQDALSLFELLTDEQVTRFMSRPPENAGGFEHFFEWVRAERRAGHCFCFAIVPEGRETAVGLIQGREIEPGFGTAEWGFALGRPYWGTGLFMAAARLVVDFVFRCTHAHRLEARALVENGRGNGVLRKLGAIPEGILRKSFKGDENYLNQVLWSLNAEDWLARTPSSSICRWRPAVAEEQPAADHAGGPLPAWTQGLPTVRGDGLTLREPVPSDAPVLRRLAAPEVTRYIPSPPDTVEGFERFVNWVHARRKTGKYACYTVVPDGEDGPAGLFQIRQLEPTFKTAEWGFLFASAHWGTGLFIRSAPMVLDVVFDTLGVHRLEARAPTANGRANGALRKLGATLEGELTRSFLLAGQYYDDSLWSILKEDWVGRKRSSPKF